MIPRVPRCVDSIISGFCVRRSQNKQNDFDEKKQQYEDAIALLLNVLLGG
jgi:hypothetical protein